MLSWARPPTCLLQSLVTSLPPSEQRIPFQFILPYQLLFSENWDLSRAFPCSHTVWLTTSRVPIYDGSSALSSLPSYSICLPHRHPPLILWAHCSVWDSINEPRILLPGFYRRPSRHATPFLLCRIPVSSTLLSGHSQNLSSLIAHGI